MILYRYIIREHFLPFCYSFAIVIFFLVMQLAVQLLEKIIEKGLDPLVVLELFIIQLGWIVALAIPMAILVATLITFGRMSADNEIVSIKASGINLYSLITPVIMASLVLGVALIYFNNDILPDANHRAANLSSDISRKKPAALIDPGVLIKDFTNYVLHVGKVNHRTGAMKNVTVFSSDPAADPSVTVAESAMVTLSPDGQFLQFTLYNGETKSSSRTTPTEHLSGRFDDQVFIIRNIDSELQRTESAYRGDREKNSTEMLAEIAGFRQTRKTLVNDYGAQIDTVLASLARLQALRDAPLPADSGSGAADSAQAAPAGAAASDTTPAFAAWAAPLLPVRNEAAARVRRQEQLFSRLERQIKIQDQRIAQFLVEVHKKFSLPVTCIVFVLIGAPLGIMARKGGLAVGTSYSIFFFLLFWSLLIGGESLADRLIVPPAVAMWSGNAVVGLCGLLLITRMIRETRFLTFDPVISFFHRIFTRRQGSRPWLAVRLVTMVAAAPFNLFFLIIRKVIGILPSYLMRKFTGHLVGEMAAMVIVFVILDYVGNLRRFYGASFSDVGRYYLYYAPWIAQTMLPLVTLLATMFSMVSLAKHSELIAMKGSGISIRQLTVPLLVLGIGLAAGSFYFGEKVIPAANQRRKELTDQLRDMRVQGTTAAPGKGPREFRRDFYYFGDRRTIYYFQEFRTRPQLARNVRRETVRDNRVVQQVRARSAEYRGGVWYLLDGTVRQFGDETVGVTAFDTLPDTVLQSSPEDMVVSLKGKEEMSYWELRDYIDKVRRQGERVSKYTAELYFKIALPVMNCIVILIGIALTARMGRRGGAVLFGIGLMMTFCYWIMARFALAFAQNGTIPPLAGAWFGNLFFLVIGLVLYRKALR